MRTTGTVRQIPPGVNGAPATVPAGRQAPTYCQQMTAQTRRNGLQLGRVLGVPIFLTPSWFLFAAFITLSYGPLLTDQFGPVRAYLAATSFAVLLGLSVLLHEIGHCVVARAFRLPVRGITIRLLAGVTEITEPPQTPGREYCVAVAGPAVSLLLCVVGLGAIGLFDEGGLARLLVQGLAVTNGLVAGFNLLPGLPLDGGRVLRSLLWKLTGDPQRATVLSARAGRVVALVLVPGLLLLVLPAVGLGNRGVTNVVFAALVAAFIYAGATASLQRAQVVGNLPTLLARRLARPALTVRSDLPVSEAVRLVAQSGSRGVVVVDASNRPEAIVSEAAVTALPEARRPWVSIGTLARQITEEMVLDADLSGEDLLAAMRRHPMADYVVRDRATGALGVLATADVSAAVTA